MLPDLDICADQPEHDMSTISSTFLLDSSKFSSFKMVFAAKPEDQFLDMKSKYFVSRKMASCEKSPPGKKNHPYDTCILESQVCF